MADNVSIFGGPRSPLSSRPLAEESRQRAKRVRRSTPRLSITIVAGQPLVRDLLAQWLNRACGNAVVRALASTDELVRHLCADGAPPTDLVVIGCAALPAEEISATVPHAAMLPAGVPVMVVADAEEAALITALIRQGLRGYVPTRIEPDVADAAVRLVLAGGTYVPPCAVLRSAPGGDAADATVAARDPIGMAERILGLTRREAEVLAALKVGMSNRGISDALGISESTVTIHVRNLMRKMGATNRTEAVYMALRQLDCAGRPSPDEA